MLMTHCPVLRKLVSKTLVESELDRLHSYQDTKPQHTIQSHDDGQQMPQLSLSPGCLVLTGLVRRGFIPKNHRLDIRRKIPGGGGILWQTAQQQSPWAVCRQQIRLLCSSRKWGGHRMEVPNVLIFGALSLKYPERIVFLKYGVANANLC